MSMVSGMYRCPNFEHHIANPSQVVVSLYIHSRGNTETSRDLTRQM